MNAGMNNSVRQWIFTLVIAAVMATAATTVALNFVDSEETAADHMWYAGPVNGDGNGGG